MILQNSRHVAEIGILYPIADLQARYNFTEYQVTNGREHIRGNDYYNFIGMMTTKVRTDYTLIHPEVLDAKCVVTEDGLLKLNNKNNYEEYRMLIVPWNNTIHITNLDKIKEFASNGGTVLFVGAIPRQSAESGMNSVVRTRTDEIMKYGTVYHIEDPNPENMKAFLAEHLPEPIINVESITVVAKEDEDHKSWPDSFRDTDYAYNYIHKVKDGKDFFFFGNPTDYNLTANISFRKERKSKPELWNPHTGRIEELPHKIEAGRISVTLSLDKINSRFIVFE
jgi:hypothetical protein